MIHLRKRVIFIWMTVIIAAFSLSLEVSASEWQIVGPRALGMGGANVAVANDATASYWNPGAFGFFDGPEEDYYGKRGWSSTVSAGIGAQLHNNFGDTISQVTDINFDGFKDNSVSAAEVSDFIGLLDGIEGFRGQDNQVASISGVGQFGVQSGHFGFGGNAFLDVTAIPKFDFENIGPDNTTNFTIADFSDPNNLGCPTCSTANTSGVTTLTGNDVSSIDTQLAALGWTSTQRNGFINAVDNGLTSAGQTVPSDIVDQVVGAATLADAAVGGGALSDNTSSLRFIGIALFEIPLTYGRALSKNLSIGGNLKYMKARIYDAPIDILNQDFGDALDDALDNYQEDSNFGLDLGALYRVGDSFRVGLVGRNLNAPKFGNFTEDAQIRTGIAYQPNRVFTFAADVDLTKNDASVGSRLKSQNVAAGLELDLIFLQLRGGAYKNMAENGIGLVYTAGIGINLWLVNLDIGAAMSQDKTNIDGESVPEEARAEFALSMLF